MNRVRNWLSAFRANAQALRAKSAKGYGYWLTSIVLILGGIELAHALNGNGWWRKAGFLVYKGLVKLSAQTATYPKETAVVWINDDDYWNGEWERRYPLKRDTLAKLLRAVKEAGARAIGVDVSLRCRNPDCRGELHDSYRTETENLLQTIDELARDIPIVLPKSLTFDESRQQFLSDGDVFDGFKFQSSKVSVGHTHLPTDVRQLAFRSSQSGMKVSSFAASLVHSVSSLAYETAIDRSGTSLPYVRTMFDEAAFRRAEGSVSAGSVLAQDPAALKCLYNKVVIIGGNWHRSAHGRGPHVDEHDTPRGKMPGALIHANYVDAILTEQLAAPGGRFLRIACEIVIGLLLATIFAYVAGYEKKIAYIVLLAAGAAILSLVSWANAGLFIDCAPSLILIAGHAAFERVMEWRHAASGVAGASHQASWWRVTKNLVIVAFGIWLVISIVGHAEQDIDPRLEAVAVAVLAVPRTPVIAMMPHETSLEPKAPPRGPAAGPRPPFEQPPPRFRQVPIPTHPPQRLAEIDLDRLSELLRDLDELRASRSRLQGELEALQVRQEIAIVNGPADEIARLGEQLDSHRATIISAELREREAYQSAQEELRTTFAGAQVAENGTLERLTADLSARRNHLDASISRRIEEAAAHSAKIAELQRSRDELQRVSEKQLMAQAPAKSARPSIRSKPPKPLAPSTLRYSIMVDKFEDISGSPLKLGDEGAKLITSSLRESGRFVVVEPNDKVRRALSDHLLELDALKPATRMTAMREGMAPAQLLVKGLITHVKDEAADQGGGFSVGRFRINAGRKKTEVRATLQVIDVTTGTLVAAKNFTGTAQSRSFGVRNAEATSDDYMQEALEKAIQEAIPWIAEQLPSVTWRGTVVKVDGERVIINRGAREGISSGDEFVVGEYAWLRDQGTAETLEEVVERARIRVLQVNERTAICEVITGRIEQIIEGMVIQNSKAPSVRR